MKTQKVIIYSDYEHSSCSHWRSTGVWNELSKLGLVEIGIGSWNDTWVLLRQYDIAFFQRPMSSMCLDQILMAKDLGLKVIIDLDDYNKIPETHPIYSEYKEHYDEKSFTKIMMVADIVTVSTEYLKTHYLQYSNNVVVVKNALNDYWLKFRKFKTGKNIFLRAGDHREQDIYDYKDSIIEVMNDNPDWKLITCGSNPIFLQREIENYSYVGDHNIHNYFALILQLNISIFILPLQRNELNYGKSDIGWQEATLSGSVALTPVWWDHLDECSLHYNDNDSFYENLTKLIDDEKLRKELYDKSYIRVQEEHLLSKVNDQRIEIVKKLMK